MPSAEAERKVWGLESSEVMALVRVRVPLTRLSRMRFFLAFDQRALATGSPARWMTAWKGSRRSVCIFSEEGSQWTLRPSGVWVMGLRLSAAMVWPWADRWWVMVWPRKPDWPEMRMFMGEGA